MVQIHFDRIDENSADESSLHETIGPSNPLFKIISRSQFRGAISKGLYAIILRLPDLYEL